MQHYSWFVTLVLVAPFALAQEDTEVSGTLSDRNAGKAKILILPYDVPFNSAKAIGTPGTINPDGSFSMVLPPTVPQEFLHAPQAPFGSCNNQSISPINVGAMDVAFYVVHDGDLTGTLRQEFIEVWHEPGSSFIEWIYFTDDAEITATCEREQEGAEPGSTVPIHSTVDLEVQRGWNQVVYQLVEPSSPERLVERISSEAARPEVVWQATLFGGVGIAFDAPEAGLVTGVRPDFPAEAAGIRKGDVIVEVDGERIGSKDELPQKLRGVPGTPVTLGVKRQGVNGLLYFELKRAFID